MVAAKDGTERSGGDGCGDGEQADGLEGADGGRRPAPDLSAVLGESEAVHRP